METPARDKTATGYPPPQNPAIGCYPVGGGAYPFAVPPPPSSSPTFYQKQRPTGFYQPPPPPPPPVRSSFLCPLFSAIAAVFTLVTLIIFITQLILKARIPEFRVDSASVTSLNTTGPDLTARWDITLVVTNPNRKLAVSYDTVSASVCYGQDRVLASTFLAANPERDQGPSSVRGGRRVWG